MESVRALTKIAGDHAVHDLRQDVLLQEPGYPGMRCPRSCLSKDFIEQKKSWLPTKFFFNLKIYILTMKKMQKKIQKNPGTVPVPGPKVFFTTIFTLKITLSPGTGTVPGFFEFFLHFLSCPYIF